MTNKINNQDDQYPALFSAAEEDLIRSRFAAFNERIGLEPETPTYAVNAFQKKLDVAEKGSSSPRSFGLRSLILAVLSSLSIGILVTRVALMPSLEAARSSSPMIEMKGEQASYQLLKLKVDDPNRVGRHAAVAAVSAGLAIRTEESSSEFKLAIRGLSSLSADHSQLKQILGLNSSAQGDIYVVLSKP
jgi:hypothetical protein